MRVKEVYSRLMANNVMINVDDEFYDVYANNHEVFISMISLDTGIIISINNVIQSLGDKYNALKSFFNDKNLDMNTEYYLNWSFDKLLSPMAEKLLLYSNNDVDVMHDTVARVIVNKNIDNWLRVYEAYFNEQYNPIHNYDMEEDENVASKVTVENEVDLNTYGFDSSQPTPTNKNSQSNTQTQDFNDNKRKLTRKGNIGVTTTQKMLEDEISLRRFKFINSIYKDVDKSYTLSVY